jgi:hypothetical protein
MRGTSLVRTGRRARGKQRAAQVTAAGPPCDKEFPSQAEGATADDRGVGVPLMGSYAICWCPPASTTVAVPGC